MGKIENGDEELGGDVASTPLSADTSGQGRYPMPPPDGYNPFNFADLIEQYLRSLASYTEPTECPGKYTLGVPEHSIADPPILGETLCNGISCSQCHTPWDTRSQHELDLARWGDRIWEGAAAGDLDCLLAQAVLRVNAWKEHAADIVLDAREHLDALRWQTLIETVRETILPRKGGQRQAFVRALWWWTEPTTYPALLPLTGIPLDPIKRALRQ